jgi:hypothetical protein
VEQKIATPQCTPSGRAPNGAGTSTDLGKAGARVQNVVLRDARSLSRRASLARFRRRWLVLTLCEFSNDARGDHHIDSSHTGEEFISGNILQVPDLKKSVRINVQS